MVTSHFSFIWFCWSLLMVLLFHCILFCTLSWSGLYVVDIAVVSVVFWSSLSCEGIPSTIVVHPCVVVN